MNAMRGALVVFAMAASLACAPRSQSAKLTGDWISGTGTPPTESVVRVTRPCGASITHWRVTHDEPSLHAILVTGTALTGAPHALPVTEQLSGARDPEGIFVLEGTDPRQPRSRVPYRLHWMPQKGQLIGTRQRLYVDGSGPANRVAIRGSEPVWFARVEVDAPADCEDALTKPAPFDLTGAWLASDGRYPEPAIEKIWFHLTCSGSPAQWLVEQRGMQVSAMFLPQLFNQGIVSRNTMARPSEATGTIEGLRLRLAEPQGGDDLDLHYDPESGHLRGTRNGRGFWAVRYEFSGPPEPCLPAP